MNILLRVRKMFDDIQNDSKRRRVGEKFWTSKERAEELLKKRLVEILDMKESVNLEELSYKELQEMAKGKGIPANQKKDELIKALQ